MRYTLIIAALAALSTPALAEEVGVGVGPVVLVSVLARATVTTIAIGIGIAPRDQGA